MAEKHPLDTDGDPLSESLKYRKTDGKESVGVSLQSDNASATSEPHDSTESLEKASTSKDKKDRNRGRRKRDPEQWKSRGGGWGPKEGSSDAPKEPRLPKRECALMIGFCGSAYRGMQFQRVLPDLLEPPTIEGVLFRALVAAGAVSNDNANDPVKVGLSRAARTDAGVHAVGNIVSLKMIMQVPGVDDMLAHINSKLPPDIRLWGFQRVQNSFDARLFCDARKYIYFFPSYLLIPPKPGSGLYRVLKEHASSQGHDSVPWDNDPFWTGIDPSTSTPQEDLLRKRAWRATPAHVERLREVIKKFEKTHNFHNFTVARDPKDKTNQRNMKKLEIAEPAVYEETEWIAVLLDGQSFLLHQRKMIFMLVMLCRTQTPSSVLDEIFGLSSYHIPKMPALGLLLDHPVYTAYNTRLAKLNLDPSHQNYREPIEFEKYSKEMNAFREKHIYDDMRSIEDRKGLFDGWIRSVDSYKGNDFLYLNPQGIVPPEAIVTKGERRALPFREKKVFNATSFADNDHEKVQAEAEDEYEEETEGQLTKKQLEETEG